MRKMNKSRKKKEKTNQFLLLLLPCKTIITKDFRMLARLPSKGSSNSPRIVRVCDIDIRLACGDDDCSGGGGGLEVVLKSIENRKGEHNCSSEHITLKNC